MVKSSQQDAIAFSAGGGSSSSPFIPRMLGSAIAGASELFLFHPVDTIAKRLMSNQGKLAGNVNSVVFGKAANDTAAKKALSLFPGLGFAAGYKILQRVYKFGGQPYVNDWMNKNFGSYLQSSYGVKTGKLITASLSGSLMGIGEIVLLPLDVLKIKAQTNPEAFKGFNIFKILSNPRELYKGAGWTAARNAPGSFALFGGSAFTHYVIFKLEDSKKATFWQNFVASFVGGVCSIVVAAPLDVVKTRIQGKDFGKSEKGVRIIATLVREEGFGGFFKGLVPKILVVGPKLIFSFTIAQTMISYFEKNL